MGGVGHRDRHRNHFRETATKSQPTGLADTRDLNPVHRCFVLLDICTITIKKARPCICMQACLFMCGDCLLQLLFF